MNTWFFFVQDINQFLWSGPLLLLLSGTHIYFTLLLKFPQKHLLSAIRMSVCAPSGESKNFSVFATLSTTLASTLGTGNIVGVSTAVALGGPMYVWEIGLHNKSIGKFYAFLTFLAALFVGCFTQANAVTQTTELTFHISPYITGLVTVVLIASVILKGNHSIANACMKIVPVLGILYTLSCILLLWINRSALLPAIILIVKHALAPRAALGGAAGSSLMLTARFGIARGLFTNEAGIGTAAITAAATSEQNPVRQAYVSMTAVFWDTVVMCLLSGLVIVTNMILHPDSLACANEGSLVDVAFSYLPFGGNTFLSLCLAAFAVTTLIGWSYMGQQAYGYLTGNKGFLYYKLAYLVMIFIGAILPLRFVWECADLVNACMVIPSVGALFLLQKELRIT